MDVLIAASQVGAIPGQDRGAGRRQEQRITATAFSVDSTTETSIGLAELGRGRQQLTSEGCAS